MSCGCEHRASSRDPDPWRNASDADEHAHKLEQVAFRTRPQRQEARYRASFARNAKAAAEAFEVAADAWEEVGDHVKAEIRRSDARSWYVKAFTTLHSHLSHDYYLISDAEARQLAAKVNSKPPTEGRFHLVPLTHVGPGVELHRLYLTDRELFEFRRKRPWAYAVAVPRVS